MNKTTRFILKNEEFSAQCKRGICINWTIAAKVSKSNINFPWCSIGYTIETNVYAGPVTPGVYSKMRINAE